MNNSQQNRIDILSHISPPFQYLCPISHTIMIQPVITVDGHTFDRESIQKWFQKGHKTNPLTNKQLVSCTLIVNRCLKNLIDKFVQEVAGEAKEGNNSLEQWMPEGNHYNRAEIKIKTYMNAVNRELVKKFPEFIDDFGMVKIRKLQKIINENKSLKEQNISLKKSVNNLQDELQHHKNHHKNQVTHYFSEYRAYNGQLDYQRLSKRFQKLQKHLHQTQALKHQLAQPMLQPQPSLTDPARIEIEQQHIDKFNPIIIK